DDDVDGGVGGKRHRILVPAQAGEGDPPVAAAVACRDSGDGDRPAGMRGDDGGVFAQQRQHAGPDGAEAGERDGEGARHAPSLRWRVLCVWFGMWLDPGSMIAKKYEARESGNGLYQPAKCPARQARKAGGFAPSTPTKGRAFGIHYFSGLRG